MCKGVKILKNRNVFRGFPGGSVVKNLPAGSEDAGLIPGPGRSHMLCGATKPMCHNYGTHALQLLKPVCPTAHAQQE